MINHMSKRIKTWKLDDTIMLTTLSYTSILVYYMINIDDSYLEINNNS
jgi:hypothetical protein